LHNGQQDIADLKKEATAQAVASYFLCKILSWNKTGKILKILVNKTPSGNVNTIND